MIDALDNDDQPLAIGLIAIPLLIQTYGIFAIAYGAAKALRLPHNVAAPACLIGTSNFFELAVAVGDVEAGPDRREAPCPVYGRCGGCDLQHLDDALQLRLQASGVIDLPYQLFMMMPFVFTIVAMAAVSRSARPPAALLKPFRKEER